MGLWREYRATLKSLDVEEPIDLVVHRPPAFVIAKLAYRTPVTPNQITAASMVVGVAAGLLLFTGWAHVHLVAAGLLVLSQVLDCSDGMLARMRRSSSDLGRMLDGVADAMTMTAAVCGSFYLLLRMFASPWHMLLLIAALGVVTIQTGALHTLGYDHYKNLFQRLTRPDSSEGEDLERAVARHERAQQRPLGLSMRIAWAIYLPYLKSQRRFLGWYDPYTATRLDSLPPYDERTASIYRKHALRPLRVWSGLFGVGSLVFGLAVFNAIERLDWFMWFRVVGMNALWLLYLLPAQRRASRAAFREIGLCDEAGSAEPDAAGELPRELAPRPAEQDLR